MPTVLKLSAAEKQELSDTYDAQKMKFERGLEISLKTLFNRIANDVANFFPATGELPEFDDYTEELDVILKKSYRKSSQYFSEHYEREMQKQQDEGDNSGLLAFLIILRKEQAKKIFVDIDKQVKELVPVHTKSILNTTRNIVVSELDKASLDILSTGGKIDNTKIAEDALPEIRKKNRNRAGTISETEIGTGASIGTEVENEVFDTAIFDAKKKPTIGDILDDNTLDELNKIFLKKTWMAILDKVTREAHLMAHGQERDSDKPFIVGGELMRQPRDQSLGATLGNIINCRCNSISS